MDVSFMVDDEQQLVFVKVDEAPEKRCPDGPPREFTEDDGGVIVILQKPMAPLVLDAFNVYAVTFDGRILDEYRQGHPEFELPAGDGGSDQGSPDAGESTVPDAATGHAPDAG